MQLYDANTKPAEASAATHLLRAAATWMSRAAAIIMKSPKALPLRGDSYKKFLRRFGMNIAKHTCRCSWNTGWGKTVATTNTPTSLLIS
jgi:hypothetical protein